MANKYWVGGTGTWDASDTTHWSASSGGAGGDAVPASGDDVILDASSGGGTVTLGATPNIKSVSMGEFTGTFNGSTYGMTLNPTTTAISISGTGTRTINLGSGTYEIKSNGGTITVTAQTNTNLTLDAGTSTILFHAMASSASASTFTFTNGGKTWNVVRLLRDPAIFFGYNPILTLQGTSGTINNLIVDGNSTIKNMVNKTTTFNAMTLNGSSSSPITIQPATAATTYTWVFSGAGTVSSDYLTVSYSIVTASKFYAGIHSTDGGGNTNWNFTAPPGMPFGQAPVMTGTNI